MPKFRVTGEKLVNVVLLLVSVWYLSYAITHYTLGTLKMPKEGFMPLLLGVGMTALSGWLTIQAFLNRGDAKDVRLSISWLRFALLVGASVAYALTLQYIGYLLDTFLFLLAVLKIARVASWKLCLIVSLSCALAFWCIFKVALGIMLPSGFLPI